MDTQIVVHPYNEILLCNKKDISTDTSNNLDESHNIMLSKEASLKRLHVVQFHLYNLLELSNLFPFGSSPVLLQFLV